MNKLTIENASNILENAAGKKIAVIGDIMIDRYFWGNVTRVSPEAPVPVIDLDSETFHLGGAANVANNIRSLGCKPYIFGVLGDDKEGELFLNESTIYGIDTGGIFIDNKRPTTVKTRIIGNNQQIARLDKENKISLTSEGEEYIINKIQEYDDLDAIIFEDYNKGAVTERLIKEVIKVSLERNTPVFVDPKEKNFYSYQNVTVFKPNRREAAIAFGEELKDLSSVREAGKYLLKKMNCDNLLLTVGSEGMLLFEKNGDVSSVPTRARHVADVSGAGDTAIGTLAVSYAAGADIRDSAAMANFAAGVVCESPGIVPIEKEPLLEMIKRNNVS